MVPSPDAWSRKREESFKLEIENLNGFLKPDQKDVVSPLPVLQASDLMNRERMSVPSTKNSDFPRLDEEFHKKDESSRVGQESVHHSAKDEPLDHGISRSDEEFHRKDETLRTGEESIHHSGKDEPLDHGIPRSNEEFHRKDEILGGSGEEDETEESLHKNRERGELNNAMKAEVSHEESGSSSTEESSEDNHGDELSTKYSQNDAAHNKLSSPEVKVDKEVNEEVNCNGCLEKSLSLKDCVEDTNSNKWKDRVVPEETLQRRTSCDYEDGDLAPLPFSGALIPGAPYSGPISGPIPYSGSISRRSDGSSTSTRSFAFPILPFEWNASPVRMPPPDKRFWQKKRNWRCLSCMCCCARPTTHA